MKKHKPLNLLNDMGFWPDKVAIVDAIKEVLTIGRCRNPLPIHDFGRYRDSEWRDRDNDLVAYRSVDWYVYDALDERRMQVDSDRILQALAREPWREENSLGDHYDLFIMHEDMFAGGATGQSVAAQYVVGKAQPLSAAVISTHRLDDLWGLPYSYLKTEVMRQLCFMFGVPAKGRPDTATEGEHRYCTNSCILRPARLAPDDWDRLTADRLKHGALCHNCAADLCRFFEQAAREAG